MREKIEKLDFRNMTEEEFYEAQKVFGFKYLGKFYPDWYKIKQMNKHGRKDN